MSAETWFDDNSRYLATSLQWLRSRLQTMVSGSPDAPASLPAAVPPVAGKRSPSLLDRLRGTAPAAPLEPPSSPATPDGATLVQGDDVAAARDEAAKADPPPALLILARSLGLSDFERDIVLLAAAVDLDPGIAALCGAAQGDTARGYPTFALALQAFDNPAWDALSAHRPLRYLRLLEINQPGATPLTAAALRADERVVNYLKGLNTLDERLVPLLQPLDEASHVASSQQQVADRVVASLRGLAGNGQVPTIELLGIDAASKISVAARVCAALGRNLYRLSLDALPGQKGELETLARLWQREAILLPLALYIDAEELDGAASETAGNLQWFLSRDIGLVFVGLREPPPKAIASGIAFEVGKPAAQEQQAAWVAALQASLPAEQADAAARLLAGQFNLSLADIDRATSLAAHAQVPAALVERAWDACCGLARPRLDQLAQRIQPVATWDDLVLPAEAMALLRQIAAQVRGRYQVYEDWGYARKMTRGLGISALMLGESGTGKTMAAEVLANELRLALYRIDLSAVVSKYIGETEKNLRKLFDAAEQGGAILFFDEADALFGKRSEVKDSHDRYANIEINYLLQRMEAFSGLAILASNMKSALDPAFMRRLRFVVNFPFPGAAERARIWQKALPAEVPREAIDYERLARLNLSGGNIHSIALNAAFAAAQKADGARTVTMPLLLAATLTELRKLDKQVNDADFRPVQATRGSA